MTLQFSEDDLVRELGAHTHVKGKDVWGQNLVRRVEVAPDGNRISGSVTGTKRAPYSQTIVLAERNGKLRITGYCTCPMAFNCKHVSAVLYEVIEQRRARRDQAAEERQALEAAEKADSDRRELARRPTPADMPLLSTPAPSVGPSISAEVSSWIERLGAAAGNAPATSSSIVPAQRVLLYILNPDNASGQRPFRSARMLPVSAKARKDGTFGDVRPYDPDNANRPREQRAKFLTDADETILRDLVWLRRAATGIGGSDIRLGSEAGSVRVIDGALATGRLHYGSVTGPVLAAGEPVAATPQWLKTANGEHQRLAFVPTGDAATAASLAPIEIVLPLLPPRYVDLASGHVGEIVSGLPPSLALEVAQAPVIGAAEAGLVKEMMRTKLKLGSAEADGASMPTPSSEDSHDTIEPQTTNGASLPLPEAADNIEVRTIAPVARLELSVIRAGLKQSHLWYLLPGPQRDKFPLPIARLVFDYGGTCVANSSPLTTLEHLESGRLVLTPRDQRAELAAAERLRAFTFRLLHQTPFSVPEENARDLFLYPSGNPNAYDLLRVFDNPDRFLAFSGDGVQALAAEGWQIGYSDDYPYRLAEGSPEWWADVGAGTGIDWFSFELGIEYEGHRINLVPQLAGMLERLPAHIMQLAAKPETATAFMEACSRLTFYHTLPDGRMLPLPGERMASMLKALLELIGPRRERLADGKVKLHRAEAGLLAEIAEGVGPHVAWAASTERLVQLGRNLRRGRGLEPITPPETFKAELRVYQGDGLAWIDFLRDAGFGGVLADDMGLGKTVQALAFLTREKAEGRLDRPALIVAPTSVLPNWQSEAEKFAPGLKVLALRGLDRKALFAQIDDNDVVLTTYPLLARDYDVLLAKEFHVAILDEAQAIKNPKATVTGLAHRIKARHRLALTGTPLENNLGEVWSLFEFLSPGLLGDEATFRRTFRTPIEKYGDATAQAFLSRRLKPFLLRRTKAEVAKELPPKTEIIERIQLEGPQRDLYETVRSLMHEKVRDEIAKKGLAKSHIIFLDALLKLRQVCCDPRLLKMPQARKVQSSAKLDRLMEMIPEMVSEGRRILLFSQFTSMLALIEAELEKLEIPYVQLTGQTTDRAVPVKAFQSGKVPLFLLSLKAGGTGLNLTAADTVIHYDPWWNPAVENQATDRAYRIGQDKPVFVYKMIVDEGIETAIEQLKARKSALADALFAGASKAPLDLTESDISALFAPLSSAGDKAARKKRAA